MCRCYGAYVVHHTLRLQPTENRGMSYLWCRLLRSICHAPCISRRHLMLTAGRSVHVEPSRPLLVEPCTLLDNARHISEGLWSDRRGGLRCALSGYQITHQTLRLQSPSWVLTQAGCPSACLPWTGQPQPRAPVLQPLVSARLTSVPARGMLLYAPHGSLMGFSFSLAKSTGKAALLPDVHRPVAHRHVMASSRSQEHVKLYSKPSAGGHSVHADEDRPRQAPASPANPQAAGGGGGAGCGGAAAAAAAASSLRCESMELCACAHPFPCNSRSLTASMILHGNPFPNSILMQSPSLTTCREQQA